MSVRSKFTTARAEIIAALIERDDEVDAALTALLCNEHCLFVGPPGTAKSLLSDTLSELIDGTRFSVVLNKFTEPGELMGPSDIGELKEGRFVRAHEGMLPDCDVAFLDEVFKASSATLNVMLQVLNERKFISAFGKGIKRQYSACPLKICIGASNEWPTGQELSALFDRFLIRREVRPVADTASIDRLMFSSSLQPTLSARITLDELEQARDEVRQTQWSASAKKQLETIRQRVTEEGIIIGDRRLRKSVLACQARAYLNGNTKVQSDDLDVLSDMWWADPNQVKTVANVVVDVAKPTRMVCTQLLAEARELIEGLENESDDRSALNATADVVTKLREIKTRLDEIGTTESADIAERVDTMAAEAKEKVLASV